jgi:hypothetical protein
MEGGLCVCAFSHFHCGRAGVARALVSHVNVRVNRRGEQVVSGQHTLAALHTPSFQARANTALARADART